MKFIFSNFSKLDSQKSKYFYTETQCQIKFTPALCTYDQVGILKRGYYLFIITYSHDFKRFQITHKVYPIIFGYYVRKYRKSALITKHHMASTCVSEMIFKLIN